MFLRIGAIGMAIALSATQAAAQPTYTYEAWQKLCNDPPTPGCMTMSNARNTDGGIDVELQVIDADGTGPKLLRVLLPSKSVTVATPLQIAIDGVAPTPFKMQGCVDAQKICYADFPIAAAMAASLKAGKTLRLELGQQRKVAFPFPLDGYAGAVDGKGMTATEFRKDLERRAEEARKRLEGHAPPRR
jgi:invasion protein IalB